MAKKSKKETPKNKVIEFVLDELEPVSSAKSDKTKSVKAEAAAAEIKLEMIMPAEGTVTEPTPALEPAAAKVELESRRPATEELDLPKLPILKKENRARLQVQSPQRIYFYWSLKGNPYQALSHTLGAETAAYTLILRLINTETEREELHPIEPEGSYWFDVDAGRVYRAEIGFYSPSRPFVRVLFSNTVTTPRKSPSPRASTHSDWRVTAHKFAEVLDASGFEKDAFDVAMVGDDAEEADTLTHAAFAQLLENSEYARDEVSAEEVRFALAAISSGYTLEELRWKIGPTLFTILQANRERLGSEKTAAALSDYFDIDQTEFDEEEFGSAVGASLVHFRKRFRTRREYSPMSSSTIGMR